MNASNISNKHDTSKKPVELRQLVYCSITTAAFHVGSINEILASAQKHNIAHSVTGFLIHSGNWFLQLLEGPTESIDLIYLKNISADPRHTSLRVLVDTPVYNRNFSAWFMAYQYMDGDRSIFGGTLNKSLCRSMSRELLLRPGEGVRLIGQYLKQIVA